MNLERFLIANLVDEEEIDKLLDLPQNKRSDGNYRLHFRKILTTILHIQLVDENNELIDIGIITKPDIDSINEIEKSSYFITDLIVENYGDDIGKSYYLEYRYK